MKQTDPAIINERLERALELYRMPLAQTDRDFVERISALVACLPKPKKMVSMRGWFFSGFLMLASMTLTPLFADFTLFRAWFGTAYILPLALVMATCTIAYCSIFVISHLEELRKILTGFHGNHAIRNTV